MHLEYITHHSIVLHTDGLGYVVVGMVVVTGVAMTWSYDWFKLRSGFFAGFRGG